jgi:oxygen-independent coproporphyrinogen-3 oxidase
LEANPGTVDMEKLCALREIGLQRLSLGVQSAHPAELTRLGRVHTWEEAVAAVEAARNAGFGNLSLDLIYGLPGQTLACWEGTLDAVLALSPDHLSLYALKLESGTPLAERVASGELAAPDADLAADMYELASERLHAAGFWHYEVSNWARGSAPPSEIWALPPDGWTERIGPWISRHNLVYWRNRPWLGVGAGAHSWLDGRRWHTPLDPRSYVTAVAEERVEEDVLVIPEALARGETMMMGLRLAEGVTDARFQARFGVGLAEAYDDVLVRFRRLGLLAWDGQRVRLTAAGRLLGNQVFAAFLP